MLVVSSLLASALYLMPVAIVVAARRSRDGSPACLATLIPAAVAADLLAILPDSFAPGIHAVDCRAAVGARLFETARPTYAPRGTWYMWTGCPPVLAPSEKPLPENLVNDRRPLFGAPALAAFEGRFVGPNDDLAVACPAGPAGEPVCRRAIALDHCVPAGARWRVCALGPDARRELRRALEVGQRPAL